MGPCWARPVDSSLALLSQQEDISWSNREAVDEGCLVSKENGVGEDWASPAGHCVPRAGPSLLASVLLKRKVRPNGQAKPIKQPGPLLPGNLSELALNYGTRGKSALNS